MKITSLTIKNVGMIADTKIDVNQPLLVFYGEIRQGKTTILNAVRWVCGGSFPADIIRHGEAEASIELGFDGGCVSRSWYRSKATESKPSEVKARAVQFVRAGKPVSSPAAELKRMMNPFLLDQDFLRNKTELERKQYFAETFAVDTTALDTEFFTVQRKAQELRAKLTGYGEIDLTRAEAVDTASLRAELAKVRQQYEDELAVWHKETATIDVAHRLKAEGVERSNAAIRQRNSIVDRSVQTQDALKLEVDRLRKTLQDTADRLESNTKWLADHPREEELKMPEAPLKPAMPAAPSTAELETKFQNAAAQNVLAEQYKKNLERDKQRKADEAALKAAEDRARAIKKEKIAALSKVTNSCGVPGLAFDENGSFSFEGTQAGMLSTSQIMRLSSLLSALYPENFGIELLDRGESLGRSIFDYVQHAEAKQISVLATVVGQRPADVPEKVGVFVVKDGVVMQDEKETA